MIAILVTGSRDWADRDAVYNALLPFYEKSHTRVVLIHGDARGLDRMAAAEAERFGWTILPMPAQWARYGNGSGPERNKEMCEVLSSLREVGYECHVLAFPIEVPRRPSGTRNCMKLSREYGFVPKVIAPR